MLKGLDVGYANTKDNQGRMFRSAYSITSESLDNKPLIIDGVKYYVENGRMATELDKTDSVVNKVCTINNLVDTARYYGLHNLEVDLSVGLPITQFASQQEKLKDTIVNYNNSRIYYDNEEYKIRINRVCVNPQGISALYTFSLTEPEYIVVDVGGFTTNVALVEIRDGKIKIVKYDTLYNGIRTIYPNIIKEINNRYSNLKLSVNDADKILLKGLYVYGEQLDIDFIKPYLQEHMDIMSDTIKMKYPTEKVSLTICGGGSILLGEAFRRRFDHVKVIENPQFANAIGMYNIGKLAFRY